MASASKTSIASTNTTSGTVNIDGTLACDARYVERREEEGWAINRRGDVCAPTAAALRFANQEVSSTEFNSLSVRVTKAVRSRCAEAYDINSRGNGPSVSVWWCPSGWLALPQARLMTFSAKLSNMSRVLGKTLSIWGPFSYDFWTVME